MEVAFLAVFLGAFLAGVFGDSFAFFVFFVSDDFVGDFLPFTDFVAIHYSAFLLGIEGLYTVMPLFSRSAPLK